MSLNLSPLSSKKQNQIICGASKIIYLILGYHRAISAWFDKREWFHSLCKRVMEQDWSWNRPALDYMELYHSARNKTSWWYGERNLVHYSWNLCTAQLIILCFFWFCILRDVSHLSNLGSYQVTIYLCFNIQVKMILHFDAFWQSLQQYSTKVLLYWEILQCLWPGVVFLMLFSFFFWYCRLKGCVSFQTNQSYHETIKPNSPRHI